MRKRVEIFLKAFREELDKRFKPPKNERPSSSTPNDEREIQGLNEATQPKK